MEMNKSICVIKGIGFVELNRKDIVRHKLVERIVDAYEKDLNNIQ
jgi:phosphate starvation-inducible protein PhoH